METEFTAGYLPYRTGSKPWLSWSIAAGVLAMLLVQIALLRQQAALADTVLTLQLALATQNGVVVSGPDPARFLLDGLTPSADQALRGDCWLFATTGILEDSYRRFGVAKGWLAASEYTKLSRQALGIAFMQECKKAPISMCPINNLMPDNVLSAGNTTEGQDGSDERLMYFLRHTELGSYAAMPTTACPYYEGDPSSPFKPDWHKERVCDQSTLDQKRARNPLSFKVKAMSEHFARDDIKRQLRKSGYPLTLGLGKL